MKTIYFIFCYILVLLVIHGLVLDQSLMLTIYHRTQIPLVVVMWFVIFKDCNKLPEKIFGKYIVPTIIFVFLILFGAIFHENSNPLQILSGLVFFLTLWLYSFIVGFNYPNYLKDYNARIFVSFIIVCVIDILLELKAIALFDITRDSNIRGFSYNSAPFVFAYFIPLILFFKKKYTNAIIVVLLFVIVLSSKRGPIVGCSVAYIIYISVYERKLMTVVKILLFGVLIWELLINIIPEEMRTLVERFNMDNYESRGADIDISSYRFELWQLYFAYYQNGDLINQLFGFGQESNVLPIVEKIVGKKFTPHNSYIMVVFWYGLISFVGFMVFLYNNFVILKKKFPNVRFFKSYALFLFMLLVCSLYTPGFADSSYTALIVYHMLGLMGGTIVGTEYNQKKINYEDKNHNMS